MLSFLVVLEEATEVLVEEASEEVLQVADLAEALEAAVFLEVEVVEAGNLADFKIIYT
jgi:hypothetical protein